ncbi:GntR family transcriptional regulator [Amycolatopsis halotolerans]|uniref:GntR family transcriptional regulator n=1 Tax=Amycolatopsis halotolerans TaxID=330083 RepID=A0ABV7QD38_9PSEU
MTRAAQDSPDTTRIEVQSVEEAVVNALRDDIVQLRLKPGTRLRMAAIADRAGVSLTPARQALRRLEAEGLVVSHPRLGSRVAPLTEEDGEVVMAVCGALERRLIATGVPKLTDEDAEEITRLSRVREDAVRAADEEVLVESSFQLRDLVYRRAGRTHLYKEAMAWRQRQQRYLRYARHSVADSGIEFGREFEAFTTACLARDAAAAQTALQHIEERILEWLHSMLATDER